MNKLLQHMINAGYIDPKSLGGLPKAQVGKSVFKAPAVPAYAQGRDQLRPQQFIDVKKYQDNRLAESAMNDFIKEIEG